MSRCPAAFWLPAFASRSSHSRRGTQPSLRSAYRPNGRTPTGLPRSRARVTTGLGALCSRGQRCSSRLERVPNWRPPHSQRPVPALRHNNPSCGSLHHEASTRVQAIHPSVLPSPVTPGWNGSASAFPELRTPPTRSRTTHVEEETGHRARTWNNTHVTSDEPPTSCSLVSCDLASHRALQGGRHHARHAGREIRAGPAPDPIAGSRAAVGTGGSRIKRSWRRGSPLRVSEGAVGSRLLRGRPSALCLGDRAKARCLYCIARWLPRQCGSGSPVQDG